MANLDRRSFVGLLSVSLAALSTTRHSAMAGRAGEKGRDEAELFVAACKSSDTSRFGLGLIAETSAKRGWVRDVETRLHGGAVRPGSHELAVVARRPGRIALVLDVRDGTVVRVLSASEDRFFLGHASFDGAGERLFVAEAEIATAAGLIGVYDARHGYARIGEWPTHGTDPHEILLAADGRKLWVANGGVELHPDTGRAILNEGGIVSTLVELDLDGRLQQQISLPKELVT